MLENHINNRQTDNITNNCSKIRETSIYISESNVTTDAKDDDFQKEKDDDFHKQTFDEPTYCLCEQVVSYRFFSSVPESPWKISSLKIVSRIVFSPTGSNPNRNIRTKHKKLKNSFQAKKRYYQKLSHGPTTFGLIKGYRPGCANIIP